jgi:catechol 2,3-dioxygenase-like lactoylglutathione lyase family enzyme
MKTYLEHANISVSDIKEGIRFFKTAFPEFYIRGKGKSNGREWVHFGINETYLALNEAVVEREVDGRYVQVGVNHLGFVVENAGAVAEKLLLAGFKRSYPRTQERTRIREYFFDTDGNEFEFVEYLSSNWAERNNYDN